MEREESHAESSDEIEEMYCEFCKTKGKSRTADGFCVDCVRYYCSKCLDFHSHFLPSHVQKDKKSMPQDVCVKPCVNHADEIIKFYCSSCDKFFCSVCKQNDHTVCTTVSHLPELITKIDLTQQFNEVKEKLAGTMSDVESRENEDRVRSTISSDCAEKAKSALKAKKSEVLQWLERNAMNIEKEIEEIQHLDDKALEKKVSDLSALKDQAITVKTDLDNKHLRKNRCEFFIALKDAGRQQKQMVERLEQIGHYNVTNFEFKSSSDIEKLLADKRLGNININQVETTFTFKAEDISKLKEKVFSPEFMLHYLPWQIMAEKRNNNLAVFLKCNGSSSSTMWSCKAKAQLRIISQMENGDNFTKDIQHTFCSKENDWGYSRFIEWKELIDPYKGYCKDDTIILEVHVKVVDS